MKEVRFHGRGGQGAVTSSQVLAIAAFHQGKQSQAFPMFGVERRGAPVQSFTRMSRGKINIRSQVYEPDYVIVLDPTLTQALDVTAGLKEGGLLIINSDKSQEELKKDFNGSHNIKPINLTHLAIEVIGKPFVNICALGAFAALTGEVSMDSLKKAIDEQMKGKGKVAELNKQAAERVYRECGGK